MTTSYADCRGNRLRISWSLLIVSGLFFAGSAWAQAHHYVLRDGRSVEMTRSATELAIRLSDSAEPASTARRMAASGGGIVEDWPTQPAWPYKLLRVTEATKTKLAHVRQDPAVATARPVYRFAGCDVPVVSTGFVVLKVNADLTDAEREALFADYRVQVVQENAAGLPDVYQVMPIDGLDEDEILRAEALASDWRVLWATPDLVRPAHTMQIASTDEYYSDQWHLNNTGAQGGQADADIDAPEAWALAEGIDIIVGIFDDAIDVDHPDLRDGYIGVGHDPTVPSNQEGYEDPRPKDLGDRHGTAVLGLICARANAIGVRGVAYLSRFTASRGLVDGPTDSAIASVYTFARQENVAVHNNSWGSPGPNSAIIEEALVTMFEEARDGRGMVVLFASGNDGWEIETGWDYATVPEVIGVGAVNIEERRSSYSNWGPNVNVLAPSGDDFLAQLATTDVSDDAGYPDLGYNRGGFSDDLNRLPELDPDGDYTKYFSGTSGACPVASGVAALILSRNPLLSALDVKVIMEHTCDQVSQGDALYGKVTQRSDQYGYGRINAYQAVLAAEQAGQNGGFTWPLAVEGARVRNGQLSWSLNSREGGRGETDEFLVVESAEEFTLWPDDGACYSCDQSGCAPGGECDEDALEPLPAGVEITAVGDDLSIDISESSGRRYYGIWSRSSIGRYSFGLAVDSDGAYWDAGSTDVPGEDPDDPGTGGDTPIGPTKPAVTIFATPLEGLSPLTVTFAGNAVSANPIDSTLTAWDFDISDAVTVDSNSRNATHTYEVPAGEQRTFIARLTMYDTEGNSGSASVAIKVDGGGDAGGPVGDNDVQILVGVPGTVNSDVDTGVSPFSVELSIDATSLSGTLQSVFWDLGDGSTARSIVVPHTYMNTGDETLVFPVTATVVTATSSLTTITTLASRTITVAPSSTTVSDNENDNLPWTGPVQPSGDGTTSAGCGAFGMLSLVFLTLGYAGLRRRGRP